ncbi:MAG: hypothetical protein BJ554DRAFT_2558, partial [Olpidium bornovanus]
LPEQLSVLLVPRTAPVETEVWKTGSFPLTPAPEAACWARRKSDAELLDKTVSRMRQALLDFHAAFELNAAIAQTFFQRALVLSFQRKYAQVIDEFTELSKRQFITDASLYVLIAKAKMKCSDNQGGLVDLDHALRISPDNHQVYLQRGLCYMNLKDYAAAQTEFSKCLDLHPRFAKVCVAVFFSFKRALSWFAVFFFC